jgi:hypothetical protein
MPLGAIPALYFLYPAVNNTNMADTQTCEVGVTVAPFNMGSEMK